MKKKYTPGYYKITFKSKPCSAPWTDVVYVKFYNIDKVILLKCENGTFGSEDGFSKLLDVIDIKETLFDQWADCTRYAKKISKKELFLELL